MLIFLKINDATQLAVAASKQEDLPDDKGYEGSFKDWGIVLTNFFQYSTSF